MSEVYVSKTDGVSATELARRLGISTPALLALRKAARVQPVRVGNSLLFDATAVRILQNALLCRYPGHTFGRARPRGRPRKSQTSGTA